MKPITVNYSYYSVKDKTLATQITDTMSIYIDTKGKEDSYPSIVRVRVR